MKTNRRGLNRTKKSVKFKPTHDFLEKAVEDYLKNSGRITKIEINEKSFEDYISIPEAPGAVDEFLNGA